ncbi:MAG: ATP phosphoribosyltransferase [Thermogemmatispora sp.]|uniref:ATP phosphoribosyltransferase n=1 Tax=Thermogemmatispora sp. TaxID=1968838 RepID=UPI00262A23ED|nr:ATP phosphoribosyltransferase [Thermogemmatispora sp.]MBX5456664.1 ATP phosphoribosyltransferase [Thermogemmatispora sp.]
MSASRAAPAPELPQLRLALPGKGTLEAATLTFLAECGLKVQRSNPRQYLARISSLPELEVVFQRAADIPALVHDGDAILGITGYDLFAEYRGTDEEAEENEESDDDLIVLERDLGYGSCRLVVAVPETWIDVNTCADLWHLAGYYQAQKGRGLRIATKYPALTRHFLRRHGISHCRIVMPHGALEAAPLTGVADLIVDLTETGTTLRENHLKLLEDGVVLRSQACLIGNVRLLAEHPQALKVARLLLELITARLQARNRVLLTAYVPGSGEEVSSLLSMHLKRLVPGFEYHIGSSESTDDPQAQRCRVSGVIRMGEAVADFLEIIAALRSVGAEQIDVTPLAYRFGQEPASLRQLSERMARRR